jgi:hypothetical protein
MIACYVGYKIATLLPLPASRELTPKLWKFLVFAGAISSFANGVALSPKRKRQIFAACACSTPRAVSETVFGIAMRDKKRSFVAMLPDP